MICLFCAVCVTLICTCFQTKSDDLEQTPTTLEDLKFVLSTINDIRTMSLDVETKIRDIQERYRTLSIYNIQVGLGGVEQISKS